MRFKLKNNKKALREIYSESFGHKGNDIKMWCGRKERSDGIARNERLGICLYRAEQRDTDDRNCAFSGDAPLDNYQLSILPNGESNNQAP